MIRVDYNRLATPLLYHPVKMDTRRPDPSSRRALCCTRLATAAASPDLRLADATGDYERFAGDPG